jgi:RES domain-containing protein
LTELVAYRIAAWDTPLWVLPNRRPARFNDAGSGSTQYMSLHPLTPWAELVRGEELRDPRAIAALRPPLWAIRVALAQDALELSFANAGDYGLEPHDLVGDDHGPCRGFARLLRSDPSAPKVLIVPSTALPGTRNLVVLEPRVAIPYLWTPLDPSDVPVSLTAEAGECPRGLGELVHHRGAAEPHAGLAAWERGEELLFEEPSTAHLGVA